MGLDVAAHLDAVERSVSSPERDGRPARAITLARSFATTMEDLWKATTRAERIARWFLPVSGELRAGGHYQLEGNAGGVITACEEGSHFALTWEFGGEVSWVDVRFSETSDGRARLTITHTAPLSEDWDEYGPGATGVGWELGLMGLSTHLERPEEPQLGEVAFEASPAGRALIARSSKRWAEAAIAAGTPHDAARAAAARTTTFYTGESAGPA